MHAVSYFVMLRSTANVITTFGDLGHGVLRDQWEKGIPLGYGLVDIPSHLLYLLFSASSLDNYFKYIQSEAEILRAGKFPFVVVTRDQTIFANISRKT